MYVVFEKDFFEFFSRKVVKTKRVKAKTEIWHGRKNIFQGIFSPENSIKNANLRDDTICISGANVRPLLIFYHFYFFK